ncbi:MAG TPA: NTP transferase domain-containing protein [Saprospiraceae bacterium]|nr:NTP transferase domain-containing protein [Saprospiraceae bacterium]
MSKKTLLVLAAGMGSRYGGLKQLDALGPNGETIIDYSVYDAIKAGFDKLVFVIRPFFEQEFREKVSSKFEKLAEVVLVHQETNIPVEGLPHIPEREKPWGTGHAVLVCADAINEPFAVINADDYYGAEAFHQMASFLDTEVAPDHNSLVGYKLANTLSDHGLVSRGVCEVDDQSHLIHINERTKIGRDTDGKIRYMENEEKFEVPEDSHVSMNFWGFHPSIFNELRAGFIDFISQGNTGEKKEYFIPIIVDQLINSKKSTFQVIPSGSQWIGVTYQEDKDPTMKSLSDMHLKGIYPERLFPAL